MILAKLITILLDEHDIPHSRRKRATGKKMCRLIAVADYKFYQTIAGNDIYDAANYIVSFNVALLK